LEFKSVSLLGEGKTRKKKFYLGDRIKKLTWAGENPILP